jgi:hypothetical protein
MTLKCPSRCPLLDLAWWCTSAVPATHKSELGGSWSQAGQSGRPYLKNTPKAKKGWGVAPVEDLEFKIPELPEKSTISSFFTSFPPKAVSFRV